MIDEPLSPHWRYDLGHRKIFELRSALGLTGEGPAPSSSVFAYAVIPGITRVLTHPHVAAHRSDLALVRVEAAFASELDMQGFLTCSLDIRVEEDVTAVVTASDPRGASSVTTIHLATVDPSAAEPSADLSPIAEIRLDPARCVAFAAATWDLNPAYWDREFAELTDLGGLVAPPGLPFALIALLLEERAVSPLRAIDVRFTGVTRPGDLLDLRASDGYENVTFELVSPRGVVLAGDAVFGPGGEPL